MNRGRDSYSNAAGRSEIDPRDEWRGRSKSRKKKVVVLKREAEIQHNNYLRRNLDKQPTRVDLSYCESETGRNPRPQPEEGFRSGIFSNGTARNSIMQASQVIPATPFQPRYARLPSLNQSTISLASLEESPRLAQEEPNLPDCSQLGGLQTVDSSGVTNLQPARLAASNVTRGTQQVNFSAKVDPEQFRPSTPGNPLSKQIQSQPGDQSSKSNSSNSTPRRSNTLIKPNSEEASADQDLKSDSDYEPKQPSRKHSEKISSQDLRNDAEQGSRQEARQEVGQNSNQVEEKNPQPQEEPISNVPSRPISGQESNISNPNRSESNDEARLKTISERNSEDTPYDTQSRIPSILQTGSVLVDDPLPAQDDRMIEVLKKVRRVSNVDERKQILKEVSVEVRNEIRDLIAPTLEALGSIDAPPNDPRPLTPLVKTKPEPDTPKDQELLDVANKPAKVGSDPNKSELQPGESWQGLANILNDENEAPVETPFTNAMDLELTMRKAKAPAQVNCGQTPSQPRFERTQKRSFTQKYDFNVICGSSTPRGKSPLPEGRSPLPEGRSPSPRVRPPSSKSQGRLFSGRACQNGCQTPAPSGKYKNVKEFRVAEELYFIDRQDAYMENYNEERRIQLRKARSLERRLEKNIFLKYKESQLAHSKTEETLKKLQRIRSPCL